MGANLGIAIAKLIGFLITRSTSKLAESVHSIADTTNQVLLLWGNKRSQKPADSKHPYGYGREQYVFASCVVALLFSVGGMFAIYEGSTKLFEGGPAHGHLGVALTILVAATCLEGLSLRTARKSAQPLKKGRGWVKFIQDESNPELPILLVEDTLAVCGLLIAIAGVSVAHITNNARYDGVGSCAIGTLLCVAAVLLAAEMKKLIIGESLSFDELAVIRAAAESIDGVDFVGRVRGIHLGNSKKMVDIKVKFADHLTSHGVATVTNTAELAIREADSTVHLLFVESWLADNTPSPNKPLPKNQN